MGLPLVRDVRHVFFIIRMLNFLRYEKLTAEEIWGSSRRRLRKVARHENTCHCAREYRLVKGSSGSCPESWLALQADTRRDEENTQHVAYFSLSYVFRGRNNSRENTRSLPSLSLSLSLALCVIFLKLKLVLHLQRWSPAASGDFRRFWFVEVFDDRGLLENAERRRR
jgi:hypothetical protein